MININVRLGNNPINIEATMGKHKEQAKNANGNKLIEFCMTNGLITFNTFYKQKYS